MARRGRMALLSGACFLLGLSVCGPVCLVWAEDEAASPTFQTAVAPLLKTYCYDCHGGDDPAGERQLDQLSHTIADDDALVSLQDVLDQLNLGEMPPSDAPQPPEQDTRDAIEWLTGAIRQYHETNEPAHREVVLRRLNAREYRNTIRDLLHLNMTMFDPTETFPRDQTFEHLDNVGETLVVSGHLLTGYLEAAELAVDKALWPVQQPEVATWRFEDGFRQQPEIDQVHRKTNEYKHLTLYDVIGADKHEGAYAPIHAFAEGVPYDGYYQIRFRAQALNREHPYDDAFLGTDRNEPFRLGIVAGNRLAGPLHKPQPIEPLLAELELADEVKEYSARVWLDRGFTPRFTFRNGLMDVRNLWSRVQKKYPELFPKPRRGGIVEARYNAIAHGALPQIHIDDVEISGPFYDQWPTASQRALLGDDWESITESNALTNEQLRQHLSRFMRRAYRRPVRPEEVDSIVSLVTARRHAGRSPLEAYSDGLKAVLCSPNFLYFEEGSSDELSPQALASRLAYFLWSSMPDRELGDLTIGGAQGAELQQTGVLTSQVRRMLDDPKSDAFLEGFLDSWLTLRDLGATPPDRNDFRAYYHYDLGTAMRHETQLFMRHLIRENLSIENFLDSDFTLVNKRLAEHYGIEWPQDASPSPDGFQLVHLKDRRRGGLLGQASVLTVTANGIDTSPVLRGVWLLENILGTPPSPPPPDVEPLDPDVRGAQTIRDQLKKHRDVPACNDCHRKIDPLGFALESFDPVGKWRDTYGRRGKVESAGELPSGKSFEDIRGLKTILVGQRDLFAKALTEKLLTYALGRRLEPADRPHVDRIVQQLQRRGYGYRDLIELVATCELFRMK